MNTKQLHYLEKGYGAFPYFIVRVTSGIYMQVPIHFNSSLELKEGVSLYVDTKYPLEKIESLCLEALSSLLRGDLAYSDQCSPKLNFLADRVLNGCVVLSPTSAYYLDSNDKITAGTPPWGGVLLSMKNESLSFTNNNHFTLR